MHVRDLFYDKRLAVFKIDGIAHAILESRLCRLYLFKPFRVHNTLCGDTSRRVIKYHTIYPIGGFFPALKGVGIPAFFKKDQIPAIAVNIVIMETSGFKRLCDLLHALRGHRFDFGSNLRPFYGQPVGGVLLRDGFTHFVQIVLSLPLACEMLGDANIVHIVAVVKVVPYGVAIICLNNGEAFIRRDGAFGGDLLYLCQHSVNSSLRFRVIQGFSDCGCVYIRKAIKLLLGEEPVFTDKLCKVTLYLCPRQFKALGTSCADDKETFCVRVTVFTGEPCGGVLVAGMVGHIILNAALAGNVTVPCLEGSVYIILRKRTQKLVKTQIGIVKDLLMKPASELRYIRELTDKLHVAGI